MELLFNGQPLKAALPDILAAPYYRTPAGPEHVWSKEIQFHLDNGRSVHGFAALRETGSNSNAGFSLFRRGRVIEGSGDEGYRPAAIFGKGNSFKSQRLFGELHLEGFAVSHTKDGFRWDDGEHIFLDALLTELDRAPLPLLKQAMGFRKLEHNRSLDRNVTDAMSTTAASLAEHLPGAVDEIAALTVPGTTAVLAPISVEHKRLICFDHGNRRWEMTVEIAGDASEAAWFSRFIDLEDPGAIRVTVRLNLAHPFLVRFGHRDSESLEVILRMAIARVVSEVLARQSGVEMAGVVGRNLNEVLSRALSNP